MKKRKNGGTFLDREMYQSPAFMSLKTFSTKLIILLLDKRMRESESQAKTKKGNRRKPRFVNLDNIRMTYGELEKKYGVHPQTILRAFDELLEKGFIEVRYRGGKCTHDQNAYALIDKWMLWRPGAEPFSVREKDVRRGRQGKRIGATAIQKTPIHLEIVG